MTVMDSSALLAFVTDEPGADIVSAALGPTSRCGAANWSEVAQKILQRGRDWTAVSTLLLSYGLQVEVVTADDALHAARSWRPGSELSLADRLCLALSERTGSIALTADTAWGTSDVIHQIR